jgi:hypothetical protein
MPQVMNHGALMVVRFQSLHMLPRSCKLLPLMLCIFLLFAYCWCSNDASKICSSECQMVMNVLWTRLSERGANWRHVYKVIASWWPFYDNIFFSSDGSLFCYFHIGHTDHQEEKLVLSDFFHVVFCSLIEDFMSRPWQLLST